MQTRSFTIRAAMALALGSAGARLEAQTWNSCNDFRATVIPAGTAVYRYNDVEIDAMEQPVA